MNKLTTQQRAQILHLLCEGCSIRAITRLTGTSKNTVTKLLVDAGKACADYHDAHVRGVKSKRVQCDEIWSFCYAKAKNVEDAKKAVEGAGDVWTWTALDADTKLTISYAVGGRDAECAKVFMDDLRSRLANRVQLTTDGHKAYLQAVENAFGADIDYAQLVKIYGKEASEAKNEKRYSPVDYVTSRKDNVTGRPSVRHISTSYVERQNLNLRMGMRRFTRLTNAFSKKIDNHCHAIALYMMYCNFVRIHQSLRVTPAMQAGLTNKLWDMQDIVRIIDAWEANQKGN